MPPLTERLTNGLLPAIEYFRSKEDCPRSAEAIARFPKYLLGTFLMQTTRMINDQYPGFFWGQRFQESYESSPQRFVPENDLRKNILFLGHENYDGLKEYVTVRIRSLENFPLQDNNNVPVRGLSSTQVDNIMGVLGLVEKGYEGKKRKTGEPEFAHILRVLSSTIDFLTDVQKIEQDWKNRQKWLPFRWPKYFFFTPATVELLLLGSIMHDFVEPDKEIDAEIGQRKVMGRIQFLSDTLDYEADEVRQPGIYAQRIRQRKKDKIEVLEEFRVADVNPDFYPYFQNAMKAVNSSQVLDQKAVDLLLSKTSHKKMHIYPFGRWQQLLALFPVLIKIIDRLDNIATRTFVYNEGDDDYKPAKPTGIRRKAFEVLDDYPKIEDIVVALMTSMDPYTFRKFGYRIFPEVLKWFPSRWAKLTLLGLNPNQIYHIPNSDGNIGSGVMI